MTGGGAAGAVTSVGGGGLGGLSRVSTAQVSMLETTVRRAVMS